MIDESNAMQNSPLGRLPPELRLEIFEYVFTYESLTCKGSYWRVTRKGERNHRPLSKELGATLVCKQMRKETLHLPLLLNNLVCGNEVGDFDPYYEWWIAPPLKEPCAWAYNALSKLTHALSDSTTFELHLWAYPAMSEARNMSNTEWTELSHTFRALLSVLGPAKLIVTLHFQFHFENLQCESLDSGSLIAHGETVFELRQGDLTAAKRKMALLGAAVEDKREELQQHEDHQQSNQCRVNYHKNKLSMQLMQAEQVSRRFVDIATRASIPYDTLLGMSEKVTDSSSGPQELRRDSTRPTREEKQHSVT